MWNQLTTQPSSRVQLLSTAAQVSEEEGFIAVIPDGYRASWNAGWCCGSAVSLDLDDVGYAQPSGAFEGGLGAGLNGWPMRMRATRQLVRARSLTRAIVEMLKELVCVDPALIFASGFSNGGFMSYRLACEASDLVRHPQRKSRAQAPQHLVVLTTVLVSCTGARYICRQLRAAGSNAGNLATPNYFPCEPDVAIPFIVRV